MLHTKVLLQLKVVKRLQELYGDTYNLRNVIITGTHTHAAPGGHLVDFILDISILGFSQETYNAYVEGITRVSANGKWVKSTIVGQRHLLSV